MFEPTPSLSLHRLSRHSLQDRYESDEEAVSESDTGAQDVLFSPVGSRAEIFDSDLSADENSQDYDRDEQIRAPPTVKRSRPVSSATIKRNSDATFDEDTYVFDPEEQIILELPPSDSPPQLAASTFLPPSMYVWPKPPQPANSRSRSTSPSSLFSVEEVDIQVAKKVTIMEPGTRPTLVLINALGPRSKTSKPRPSHSRSRESSRTRSVLVRADSRRLTMQRLSDSVTQPPRVSEKRNTMKQAPKIAPVPALEEDAQFTPSAITKRVSEIPSFPAPPRTLPFPEHRPRPRTSGTDKAMPPPSLNLRTYRPPSMRSVSSISVPAYTSRPSTPSSAEDGKKSHYTDAPSKLTRVCSPASNASTSPLPSISSKRSGPSTYSVSNILTSRSPLMMRRMTRKHSSSSVHSLSSLRSEVGVDGPSSSQISVATQPIPHPSADCHIVRKSSQRRHTRHASVLPSGRGFMGLKLGRKSHKT
ncbi:hypothetical protein Pdw03_7231 [Penicillium digitatum]|uniref:Uncharacterized protein n=3 Tax=Penicillium digitatum TaxID=36651 RepID=K9G1E5_PEND2|nr:hypothetical protein PDIP_51130 [Penicillium digitatum Pd1]EKV12928.1 hypothetical protein PDIP_51130 [Penicillium digitatum Pd1]EKV14702.1 hypothetical protein PDIG_31550 [Penicillium digitatum PHI26]KAG0155875.1 hypothetical protein PDIDSM_3048 [Penicillium digitatum]QQK43330.1 hypothetical protein Pdw03_7231 [Penicillium digitatum]